MLEVCICTHNPRRPVLEAVLAALVRQTAPRGSFRVLLIDNASAPPLPTALCTPLLQRGIGCRLVREAKLGLVHARLRALGETAGEWLLFVDDDAELADDYVSEGLAIIAASPGLGCFGGRLLLPAAAPPPPPWAAPALPWLGIHDHGERPIVCRAAHWGAWEPAGAGAFVRRAVLERFGKRCRTDPRVLRLGRKGGGLYSCEDSLLMRGAAALGFACAYQPTLRLTHHLDGRRLRMRHLLRLMFCYGRSHAILARLAPAAEGGPGPAAGRRAGGRLRRWAGEFRRSPPFFACRLAYGAGRLWQRTIG